MRLGPTDIAGMVDISAVQAHCGDRQVRELAEEALRHRFVAAHVLPCWVPLLRDLLGEKPRATFVGAPVGFPGGGQTTALKVSEARELVEAGVEEMDLMMNIGMLRSGRLGYVRDEVRAVVQAAAPVPTKVIIEAHWLAPDEIREACEICVEGGAAFVKTGTGWAPGGTTLETVALIKRTVGSRIGIKASGGVRGLDTFRDLLRAGVTRFGINARSALEIMDACAREPGGVITI
jgi:deoxyribose-phosphate aldolase